MTVQLNSVLKLQLKLWVPLTRRPLAATAGSANASPYLTSILKVTHWRVRCLYPWRMSVSHQKRHFHFPKNPLNFLGGDKEKRKGKESKGNGNIKRWLRLWWNLPGSEPPVRRGLANALHYAASPFLSVLPCSGDGSDKLKTNPNFNWQSCGLIFLSGSELHCLLTRLLITPFVH